MLIFITILIGTSNVIFTEMSLFKLRSVKENISNIKIHKTQYIHFNTVYPQQINNNAGVNKKYVCKT